MSIINDLIAQIDDKTLRDRISVEVEKLAKQKKFGLVFEEHLPECTPLYEIPVKKGSLVALKAGKVNDVYTVLNIEDGKAKCLHKEDKQEAEFPVEDLVCVAEFGEPIYPYLKPIDSVCNAPDSDLWHTLIEADNYHALQLLEYLYAGKVDCIYIDPPYNTGAKDWKYNNNYVDNNDQFRHSKWLSMMQKRLLLSKKLLSPNGILFCAIDENEFSTLSLLMKEMFFEGAFSHSYASIVHNPRGQQGKNFSYIHEFLIIVYPNNNRKYLADVPKKEIDSRNLRDSGSESNRTDAKNCFYPFVVRNNTIISIGDVPADDFHPMKANDIKNDGTVLIWPLNETGDEKKWRYARQSVETILENLTVKEGRNSLQIIYNKAEGTVRSVWEDPKYDASEYGTKLIQTILCGDRFSYPKSLYAVYDAILLATKNNKNAILLDFFAGSGTTLHAVNLLNDLDNGHRKCIMVTNNEVSDEESKLLKQKGFNPGDDEWEKYGIAHYVTWPRTVCSIEGHDIKGKPLKGNYLGSDLPMADGFKANAAFFKLGFLDKNDVALGKQFKEMLPTLWMKAGAIGECPSLEGDVPSMLVLPKNKFAILVDEQAYMDFVVALDEHPEIETTFIVTDSEAGYREMIAGLNVKNTYQLYRDYLDNFRINSVRR